MDWTKAKTIVMIALALTIVFLVFTYGVERITNDTNPKLVQEKTLELLAKKGVRITGKLPEVEERMPVLNVEFSELDQDVLEKCIRDQKGVHDVSEKAVLEYAEQFLKDCGVYDEHVTKKRVECKNGSYRIEYENRVKGFVLEESYMVCIVKDGIVTSLDRVWLKPQDFGKNKREVLSASEALIQYMMEKKDATPVKITDMELIYWLDPSEFDGEARLSDTAFPAWKITYNGGRYAYIKAYRSE